MKYIALILALIIFKQSLSLCAPMQPMSQNNASFQSIAVSNDIVKNEKKHSCCTSKKSNTNKHSEDNNCRDHCKCLSCLKVCSLQFVTVQTASSPLVKFENEDILTRSLYHSFDFHEDIKDPPQVK